MLRIIQLGRLPVIHADPIRRPAHRFRRLILPVQRGGAYDRRVGLRRLGPWLVDDDTLACGGMNVTVRGVDRGRP